MEVIKSHLDWLETTYFPSLKKLRFIFEVMTSPANFDSQAYLFNQEDYYYTVILRRSGFLWLYHFKQMMTFTEELIHELQLWNIHC